MANTYGIYKEQLRDDLQAEIEANTAAASTIPTGDANALVAANTYSDGLITQLKGGVGVTYDTLKKLADELIAVKAIIGDSSPDADNIIDTVTELMAVLSNYPEGTDLFLLIQGKVDKTDVYNALDCVVSGKVADARQLKVLNDFVIAMGTSVKGDKITPSTTPSGTGVAAWLIAEAGTYIGGNILPANSLGFLLRNASNVYSITYTSIVLDDYAKKTDVNALVKTDDSGNLNFIDNNGNIGAKLDKNGTFTISNLDLINQTTLIPFEDINATGLINGNKIVKNDSYQLVTTDVNGNIGYAVNLDGTVVSFQGDQFKLATGILAAYNGIEVYGQSNSIGAMAQPVLTTTTESNIFTFKKGPIMVLYDNDADRYDSLVLEKESTYETASGSLSRMLKQQVVDSGITIDNGVNPYNIIISNSGQGAMTVQNLSRGSVHYSRLLNSITNAKRLANEAGGSYNFNGMFWLQGEANESDTTKSKYIELLKKFHRELNEDVKSITGQSNDVFIINYQFSAYGARKLDVYTALMDICIDSDVFFRGPTLYPYPFADQHHLSNVGQRHVGALAGYIFDQIQNKGVKWHGLVYDTHLVSGNFVELKFKVPVKPLVLDTIIITDPGNYGFNLYNKYSVEKTITSVTLVREDKVKVTSNVSIEVGDYLTYASNGVSTTSGPVTGARGCLRDSQGETIRYQPTGLNLKLHNWLPISKIILK